MASLPTLALLTLSGVVSLSAVEDPLALRDLRGPEDAPRAQGPTPEAATSAEAPSTSEAEAAEASAEAPLTAEAEAAGTTAVPASEADPAASLAAARERRRGDPSPENWAAEGEALEGMSAWVGAIAAYREAANRASGEARTRYLERIESLDAKARAGASPAAEPDESAEATDAPASAPVSDASASPTPADGSPAPREKVITKWYFWVTVAAIAASAGAITGIAIKSAVDERDRSAPLPAGGTGATVLRF